MVATINMKKCTSTDAGTEVTVTSIALKSVDDSTGAPTEGGDASNHPVPIPPSGTDYSFETWLRWKCETTPPDNQATNFKFWTSGSMDTGVEITLNTDAVSSGVTPVETLSSEGTRDDWANHGSGAKVSVTGTLTAVDQSTNYIVLQLETQNTASQGDMTQMTAYYSYDEN